MAAKIEEKPVKKASAKKTVKKTAEVPVNGDALKKAIAEREKPNKKMHRYGEIWAMRWCVDENRVGREFIAVPVETEDDIVNYPDKIEALRLATRDKIADRGEKWFFSDDKALTSLFKDLESDMDCVRHDLEYDSRDKDEMVNRIDTFHKLIKAANDLIINRNTISRMVKKGKLSEMPKVIPPHDDYYIDEDLKKFVRRKSIEDIEKELGFKTVMLEDAPKTVQDLAKKLGVIGTVNIATAPAK